MNDTASAPVPTSHPKRWGDYLQQHVNDIFIPHDVGGPDTGPDMALSGDQVNRDIDEWAMGELDADETRADTVEQKYYGTWRVYYVQGMGGQFWHLCRCHQHIQEDEYLFQ